MAELKKKKVEPVEPKRQMKGTKKIYHDLFKLKTARFKKPLGVMPDAAVLRANPDAIKRVRMDDVDHCHYFHCVDSNGRPQKYSSSIGGHCHKVTIRMKENGEFVGECGPPLRKINNSRVEPKMAYDNHTHEIVYIQSEEFTARKANMNAVQYASQADSIPSAPQGALGD